MLKDALLTSVGRREEGRTLGMGGGGGGGSVPAETPKEVTN